MNECDLTCNLDKCSVIGGNSDIIHIVEQKGFKFSGCLETAVLMHRNDIFVWINENFEDELINTMACLTSYNEAILYYLTENGIPIIYRGNNDVKTENPVQYALKYMNFDLAQYLIDHGDDINEPLVQFIKFYNNYTIQEDGFDSLKHFDDVDRIYKVEVLTEDEVEAIIKFLISNKADVNKEDSDGHFPLQGAAVMGNLRFVKLLIYSGALLYPEGKKRHVMISAANGRNIDVVKYLYKCGADVNERGKGSTPIFHATDNNDLNIVKFLVKKGADVNARRRDRMTALHYAAIDGYIDIVKFLLDHNAFIDPADVFDETPLIKAIFKMHEDIAILLIKRGANFKYKVKGEQSPLDYATRYGCEKVVQLIKTLNYKPKAPKIIPVYDIKLEMKRESDEFSDPSISIEPTPFDEALSAAYD